MSSPCSGISNQGKVMCLHVYSEPIEIEWRYNIYLCIYLAYYPIRDKFLLRRYALNGNIFVY